MQISVGFSRSRGPSGTRPGPSTSTNSRTPPPTSIRIRPLPRPAEKRAVCRARCPAQPLSSAPVRFRRTPARAAVRHETMPPLSTSVAPPAPGAASAFWRIFNLRRIAAVYYFCLLHAVARALGWYGGEAQTLDDWLFSLIRFSRQSLLTGMSILLTVALAEAWLAGRRWSLARALPLQGLAVAIGATVGAFARYHVGSYGNPAATMKWGWFFSTVGLWTVFGCMAYAVLRVLRAEAEASDRLRQAAREREALEAQQMEAQVSALNAQIEPHFLFNTLANVKRLYEPTPDRGRDMLVSLIAYLRAALPSMRRHDSTLGQELELVRNYLTILQMRMGERLSFAIEADAQLLDEIGR